MELCFVCVRERLHKGASVLLVISAIIVQAGEYRTIIPLHLVFLLGVVREGWNMLDAEAGQRVLKVSRRELWIIIREKAIGYAVHIYLST